MYVLVVGVLVLEYYIFIFKFLFIKLCKILNRKNLVFVGNYLFYWYMCGDVINLYIWGSSIRDFNVWCVMVYVINGVVVS